MFVELDDLFVDNSGRPRSVTLTLDFEALRLLEQACVATVAAGPGAFVATFEAPQVQLLGSVLGVILWTFRHTEGMREPQPD